MIRPRTLILFSLAFCLATACSTSSSSKRQLQSIQIQSATRNGEIQFTAVGTFSMAPTTVEPLPVQWSAGLFAPPPVSLQYALTAQPYILQCTTAAEPLEVSAVAPSNPDAPNQGSLPFAQMVAAAKGAQCP
jgi:hypothetical protein